jgi:hypothetical protein
MDNVKELPEAQHAICLAMEHGMAPWTHDGCHYVVYPDGRAMKFAVEEQRDEALRKGAPTLFRSGIMVPSRLRSMLDLLQNGVVTEFLLGMTVQEMGAKGELEKEVSTALIHYFGATEECRVPKTRLRNLDGSYGREIGLDPQDWQILRELGVV